MRLRRPRPAFHSSRRRNRIWNLSLASLLVVAAFVEYVAGQSCSPTSDCHPPSADLVDLTQSGRLILTSSTCNNTYRRSVLAGDARNYTCSATAHTATMMTDRDVTNSANVRLDSPQLSTYWQSENTVSTTGGPSTPQLVSFLFNVSYLVRSIRVIFVSPHTTATSDAFDMRPRAMTLERRVPATGTWQAWRYFSKNCAADFPHAKVQRVGGVGPSYDAATAICLQAYYASDAQTYTGWGRGYQHVLFNPSREFGREYSSSLLVQKRFQATGVRLRLTRPADDVPLSSYYAIADLEIDGSCACYGHAARCIGQNKEKCACAHNTAGDNCESCQPRFHDLPWRLGFDQTANACKDCVCNRKSSSCKYDARKNSGVCNACSANTAGDKCDDCRPGYYVNPAAVVTSRPPNATSATNATNATSATFPSPPNGSTCTGAACPEYCIVCNCSQSGSLGQVCSTMGGQCTCKSWTTGRPCDRCKMGYYGLAAHKQTGCSQCSCLLAGTRNNTRLCDPDTGNCTCKEFVHGRNCDRCKDGYFRLSASNPRGCEPCDCDPGGSSSSSCLVTSGQCRCRANLAGRTCRLPARNFYMPTSGLLSLEAENSVDAKLYGVIERNCSATPPCTGVGVVRVPTSRRLSWKFTPPSTRNYRATLRYVSDVAWTQMRFAVSSREPGIAICGALRQTVTAPQSTRTNVPAAPKGGAADLGIFCVQAATSYTVNFTVGRTTSASAAADVDSLLFMPVLEETAALRAADNVTLPLLRSCYSAAIAWPSLPGANCGQPLAAIGTELTSGAIGCACSSIGSTSSRCAPQGGRCPCQPGVGARDCSRCLAFHFGLHDRSFVGCRACGCHSNGSLVQSCSSNGTCTCRANVTGAKCDACVPQHFGLASSTGCRPCTCNAQYAVNNTCRDDGSCSCKPGVAGSLCDRCDSGFFNLTAAGCTPCRCTPGAARSPDCDKKTGRCDCRLRVSGEKCDRCEPGYFALGDWGPEGCLKCFCSGHSGSCTSASGWSRVVLLDNWSLLQGPTAVGARWTNVRPNGSSVPMKVLTKFPGEARSQFVMSSENSGEILSEKVVYFSASSKYVGNKASAYGRRLSFALGVTVPARNVTEIDVNATAAANGTNVTRTRQDRTWRPTYLTDGDVVIKGIHSNFRLVASLPFPPSNYTEYQILMREMNWTKDSTLSGRPSYTEFVQVVSELEYVRIRSKFTNITGSVVHLYNVQLEMAQPSASGPGNVTGVENCTCTSQYRGQFCEKCAPGFKRITAGGGPFAACVRCSCNAHGVAPAQCDPESGTCNCTHFTAGRTCDRCADGRFGVATSGTKDDCKPCLCPADVTSGVVNVFARRCNSTGTSFVCDGCALGHVGERCERCDVGWFGRPLVVAENGGKCTRCRCNSRADTCNSTTGSCVGCRNNTSGTNCELCANGFYGNAMTATCRACDCPSGGATGSCDHRTGHCICKPNVTGRKCTTCVPSTFNITSGSGCSPCGCHPIGAIGATCHQLTGQCTCRAHVIGRTCSRCEDAFYGINLATGCKPCDCRKEAIDFSKGNGTCDLTTGQCYCRTKAILGRRCDRCGVSANYSYAQTLHLGSYPTCTACGECFDGWARRIDKIGKAINGLTAALSDLWRRYDGKREEDVAPTLNKLQNDLDKAAAAAEAALSMTRRLNSSQHQMENVSSEVNKTAVEVVAYSADFRSQSGRLDRFVTFAGVFPLPLGVARSVSSSAAESESAIASLNSTYGLANATDARIRNLTETIKQAGTSHTSFRSRVDQSSKQLEAGRQNRLKAERHLNGTDGRAMANLTSLVTQLQVKLQNSQSSVLTIRRTMELAVQVASQANTSSAAATAAVRMTAARVDVLMKQVNRVRLNGTRTLQAAQRARASATTVENLAKSTLADVTATFKATLNSVDEVSAVTAVIVAGTSLAEKVQATRLRALDELRAIDRRIQTVPLSATDVHLAVTTASAGRLQAQLALNTSARAQEEAEMAFEQLNLILFNLKEFDRLFKVAEMSGKTNLEIVARIQDSTRQGLAEAGNLTRVSSSSQALAASFSAQVDALESCYGRSRRAAQTSKSSALRARADVDVANGKHGQNVLTLSHVTSSLRTKRSSTEKTNQELQRILLSAAALHTVMGHVDSTAGSHGLQGLLEELSSQKNEIDTLRIELSSLESELKVIDARISSLDSSKARCIIN